MNLPSPSASTGPTVVPPPVASLDAVAEAVLRLDHVAAALCHRPAGAEQSYPAALCRRLIDARSWFDHPGTPGRADVTAVAAAHRLADEVERYLAENAFDTSVRPRQS